MLKKNLIILIMILALATTSVYGESTASVTGVNNTLYFMQLIRVIINETLLYTNISMDDVQEPGAEQVTLEVENTDGLATVQYIHDKLDEYIKDYDQENMPVNPDEPLTIQKLCEILSKVIPTTYSNYEYYRSHIKDTSHWDIIKCYSEGIILVDSEGFVHPNKELTKSDMIEILNRIHTPLSVTRPIYQVRTNIPIVMYHEINTLPKNGPTGLYVSRDTFVNQLEVLQKEGYNTITMEQVYQHWVNQAPLPERPIVLSFDDGYVSHYELAAVELAKRGMSGTFYIITGELSDAYITSPKNLKAMYTSGMEIGSHTVTHIDARYTKNDEIYNEYKNSKETLENIIGREIKHFCYPMGGTTYYAIKTLNELGYYTSVKTTHGKANQGQGLLELKRIRADYNDSINVFINKIK